MSSLVILYRDDYMYGDHNINPFIYLVFLFVISMIFLIIRPNIINIIRAIRNNLIKNYLLFFYYNILILKSFLDVFVFVKD